MNPLSLNNGNQMIKGNGLLGKGTGMHVHNLLDGRRESQKNSGNRASFNATGNFKSIRTSQ